MSSMVNMMLIMRFSSVRIAEHDWHETPLLVADVSGRTADPVAVTTMMREERQSKAKGPAMYISALYEAMAMGVGARVAAWCRSDVQADESLPESSTLSLIQMAARESVRLLQQCIEKEMGCVMMGNAEASEAEVLSAIMSIGHMSVSAPATAVLRTERSWQLSGLAKCTAPAEICSSGTVMWQSFKKGPPSARLQLFANTSAHELTLSSLVVRSSSSSSIGAHPLQEDAVQRLRVLFGSSALFFWNAVRGDQVYVVFRPKAFLPHKANVMQWRRALVLDSKESGASGSGSGANNIKCITSATTVIAEMISVAADVITSVDFV